MPQFSRRLRNHAPANYGLGMLLVHAGKAVDALPYLTTALQARLDNRDYWLGYVEALSLAGQIGAALDVLTLGSRHGLAGPDVDDFAGRLAAKRDLEIHERESSLQSLVNQQRRPEALAVARDLTERFANRSLGWKTLGALLLDSGGDAIPALQKAVELIPGDSVVRADLALALARKGRLDEAVSSLHEALRLAPQFAAAHYRLGVLYEMQGKAAAAVASCGAGSASVRINLLAKMHCAFPICCFSRATTHPWARASCSPNIGALANTSKGWYRGRNPPHANERNPERCLNVGFVSGDLYEHAAANFLEPALAQLARRPGMKLHAYYTNSIEDAVTLRLRSQVERWNSIGSLSDAELEKRIRSDRIDVLIDLSGHTRLNRLTVFAGKPAPIQASWLGYPGTTGLQAMDYYLGDRRWLPPGQFTGMFTEKLVYLPDRWTFQPHRHAPLVNSLPALEAGHLTFGSFHRAAKINSLTIRTWSDLLLAIPQARLLLVGSELDHGQSRLAGAIRGARYRVPSTDISRPLSIGSIFRIPITRSTSHWTHSPTPARPRPCTRSPWECPRSRLPAPRPWRAPVRGFSPISNSKRSQRETQPT